MKKILTLVAIIVALGAVGIATQMVLGPSSYAGVPAPAP